MLASPEGESDGPNVKTVTTALMSYIDDAVTKIEVPRRFAHKTFEVFQDATKDAWAEFGIACMGVCVMSATGFAGVPTALSPGALPAFGGMAPKFASLRAMPGATAANDAQSKKRRLSEMTVGAGLSHGEEKRPAVWRILRACRSS